MTTIYVTHDQSEAMALSDRIAVMSDGLIAQVGTPGEIYERPRTEFVANFIGRSNVFRGTAGARLGAGEVVPVDTPIGALRCLFAGEAAPSGPVAVMIRPENVELAPANGAANGAGNTVHGAVKHRVFLGEIAEYTIALDGAADLIAALTPRSRSTPASASRCVSPSAS